MEGTKNLGNRKGIALVMMAQTFMLLYNTITSYINLRDYFEKAASCILVPGIITVVGLAVIVYCLFNKRKDIVLLGGVAIATFGYVIGFIANNDITSLVNMLLWLAICLLTLMVTSIDKIPLLAKIQKHSITIGKTVAAIFILHQIYYFISQYINRYDEFYAHVIIFGFMSGMFTVLVVAASYGAFAIYLGRLAQGEEDIEVEPEINATEVNDRYTVSATGVTGGKMKKSVILHTVLLIVTCGIWYFFWIQRVTDYVDKEAEKKRTPVAQLLLCLYIPFYFAYWAYDAGKKMDAMYQSRGKESDNAGTYLILGIFTGVISTLVIQNDINKLEDLKMAETSVDAAEEVEE